MIRSFLQRLRGKAQVTESSRAGWDSLTGWRSEWQNVSTVWPVFDNQTAEDSQNLHAIVYACCEMIMTSGAEPDLELGRYNADGGFEPVAKHPALDLIEYPNPVCNLNTFIQALIVRLRLTGETYVIKNRMMSGRKIAELWPVPTSWVTPVRAEGLIIDRYSINNLESQTLPADDVIRAYIPSARHPWEAARPLKSAANDYRLDIERSNYQAEMLINLKMPGLAVNVGSGPSGAMWKDKVQEQINNIFGRGNRGNTIVFGGEKASIDVLNPLSDMDWPGTTGLSETRICAALGVPPILIGSRAGLDKATYSNYGEAKKSFYTETMRPLWSLLEDALTFGLLRAEGISDLYYKFRYDRMPYFQEDQTALSNRIGQQFKDGLITLDEARAALGYDAMPESERPDTEQDQEDDSNNG